MNEIIVSAALGAFFGTSTGLLIVDIIKAYRGNPNVFDIVFRTVLVILSAAALVVN